MSIFKNLKDPITDLLGLAILVITLVEIYRGDITWIWEGCAGMAVGAIFFLAPDATVLDLIKGIIKKFTNTNNNP